MKIKKQKEIKKDEFRRNKETQHPAYIYARIGNEYKYLGVTHSEITKGIKNIKLDKNPNPKDKKNAYITPNSEKQQINKFKKKNVGWKMSKTDKVKLKNYMK